MQEKKRLQRTRSGPDPASFGDDGDRAAAGAPVTVTHGIYAEPLPVAEMSVAQVRARFADRLDIHPEATAMVDGQPVDEQERVHQGQILSFIRPAGEKGGVVEETIQWLRAGQLELELAKKDPVSSPTTSPREQPVVTIEGGLVHAHMPEGTTAETSLRQLLDRIRPNLPQTGDMILPDGVKAIVPVGGCLVVVHQTAPRVHALRWIAAESEQEFGPGTRYRTVRVALPYVIVLAAFEARAGETPVLSGRNECFFSDQPLDGAGLDTPLAFPALLNCSRFPVGEEHPLSWICTQNLDIDDVMGRPTEREAIQAGLAALLRHLFESGFNRSSESHELSSWFAETVKAQVDPRLASIEAWESATAADPLFALDVPWLATGKTLREIVHRMGRSPRRRSSRPTTARELARLVFQLERRARRTA